MVYKPFSVVAVVVALALAALPAHAAAPTPASPAGKPLGIVPVHQQAKSGGVGNLLYHSGGSVQTGTHHTYAIYWGASSTFPDSNYQTLINRYFGDVAAASGQTSNVYYSDTQYYQTINSVTTNISYSESFSGSWADTTNPTSSGCSSTAGGTVACVSDAQIQQEVQKALNANSSWADGQGSEFFVFLGNGISTCSGSSCFVSQFCAYHSHFTDSAGHTALYANMPYTGYSLTACGSGQYPNNDAAADSTINVTSHEANETITDDLGNAWYDRTGYETGDKCAWKFGTALGNNGSGSYNQVINGDDYFLQGEWSNYSSGCVWSGT